MTRLDVIRIPGLTPTGLIGLQLHLLSSVAARACAPVLVLYQLTGEIISIGRYHFYDGTAEHGGVHAYRRLTGGRVINAGEGWIGSALILPSRAVASGGEDSVLRPEQVMNRCVRGALTGLRAMGLECFYPGRDALTSGGRELAMCSFEETPAGVLLFELFIAGTQGLDSLPPLADRFDPDGALTCQFYTSDTSTTVARELGRKVTFSELAGRLEAGYLSAFSGGHRRDLSNEEIAAAQQGATVPDWPGGSQSQPGRVLRGRDGMQLGIVEVRLVENDGHIQRIGLYGDFIANSAGLVRFERILTGKRLNLMTLNAAIRQVYGDGANFILGCGDPANLARLILKAS